MLSRSLVRIQVLMVLLAIASAVALLLSAVGLAGVIAYVVSRRRPEIGIRIALGASATAVRGQIVRQAIRLGLIGGVLGVIGSLAVTGYLRSVLYGVTHNDPVTITLAALVLLMVAIGASLIPAHRATLVDPVEAMRE